MDLMMKTESWDYDHFSVHLSTTFDESPHRSTSTSPTVHVLGGKPAGGSGWLRELWNGDDKGHAGT